MSEYVDDDRTTPRFRVNRKAMVEPQVFAEERGKIFNHSWLYLGHETELRKPNDFITRNVGGRPVVFTRDAKGEIRVWINSCPHRGATLCREPQGNGKFMTCMYHGWSFSNRGELVSIPDDASYGENFIRPGLAAPPHVDSYRGFVFVSFDPDIVDLTTYLAGATEYIDLVADQSLAGMEVLPGSHEYSVKANWKLLLENSYDAYHTTSAHQRYLTMVLAARGALDPKALGETRAVDLGNGHAVTAGASTTAGLFGRPLSDEGERQREQRLASFREAYGDAWVDRMQGARNLVIFPNLVIIDLVMGVIIRKIDPVSPDYMEVSSWQLVPPDETPELRKQRLDNFLTFWGPGGLATPDDVEALESCQRAFASSVELPWSDISRGMHKPVPAATDEFQMRTWWRQWNEILTGEVLPPEPHEPLDGTFIGRRNDTAVESRA
ncbi:aromatic ring-hydroxylating dioxygenase subunit alpha [Nocardia vinacea]|uniref:Aromatic ring-hydroxylating dioxygenase subunit alpha n=1 Tax=Nocardia vinacea TaxID=96468 RepID=A0ABZ1YTT2_9NOCA|nr:aromatic ring-hydroxylating dioxygenase subunit alpha [Nocardia vinacea]